MKKKTYFPFLFYCFYPLRSTCSINVYSDNITFAHSFPPSGSIRTFCFHHCRFSLIFNDIVFPYGNKCAADTQSELHYYYNDFTYTYTRKCVHIFSKTNVAHANTSGSARAFDVRVIQRVCTPYSPRSYLNLFVSCPRTTPAAS